MRIDLIPERDRFIPGWHNRPEPGRAEQSPPEWRWPRRLLGAVRVLLSNLLPAYYAAKLPYRESHHSSSHRNHNSCAMGHWQNRNAEGDTP
jgi:hypothetical protein